MDEKQQQFFDGLWKSVQTITDVLTAEFEMKDQGQPMHEAYAKALTTLITEVSVQNKMLYGVLKMTTISLETLIARMGRVIDLLEDNEIHY